MRWIETHGPKRRPGQPLLGWLMTQEVDHDNLAKLAAALFAASLAATAVVKLLVAALAG